MVTKGACKETGCHECGKGVDKKKKRNRNLEANANREKARKPQKKIFRRRLTVTSPSTEARKKKLHIQGSCIAYRNEIWKLAKGWNRARGSKHACARESRTCLVQWNSRGGNKPHRRIEPGGNSKTGELGGWPKGKKIGSKKKRQGRRKREHFKQGNETKNRKTEKDKKQGG